LDPSGRTAVKTIRGSSSSAVVNRVCTVGRELSTAGGRRVTVRCSGDDKDSSDRHTDSENEELLELFSL